MGECIINCYSLSSIAKVSLIANCNRLCYAYTMVGMNERIRGKIKEEMKRKKMSINALSSKLDMPRPNLSRLLNGRSGKVPESWQAILDELDLELVVQPKKK